MAGARNHVPARNITQYRSMSFLLAMIAFEGHDEPIVIGVEYQFVRFAIVQSLAVAAQRRFIIVLLFEVEITRLEIKTNSLLVIRRVERRPLHVDRTDLHQGGRRFRLFRRWLGLRRL